MALRQMIIRLLRTQDRRIERIEDQTQVLGDIKDLLVGLRSDFDDLRGRVISLADEHGSAIRHAQREIMAKESRLALAERAIESQAGELAELKGTVIRLRAEHSNGAAE